MLTEKITITAPKYFIIVNQKNSLGLILICVSCLDPNWRQEIFLGEYFSNRVYSQSITSLMLRARDVFKDLDLEEPVWHPNFTGSEVKFFSQVYIPSRTSVS